MKLKIHGMFLSLFFALAFCFSFSIEASAHPYERSDGQRTYEHSEDINISAAEVRAGNEDDMKKFVRHVATHLDRIQTDTTLDEETNRARSIEMVIFARDARVSDIFNNEVDIYAMGVTRRGAITNHGLHPNLYGYKYDSSEEPLRTLLGDNVPKLSELSDTVGPECARYDNGNRVACAVRQETPAGLITTIAGFHHAEDEYAEGPKCDEFALTVKAERVEKETDLDMKRDLLQKYLKEVIKISLETLNSLGNAVADEEGLDPFDPNDQEAFGMAIGARFYEKAPCFRSPDLLYGSIYAFIMDPLRGVAFLSGNDFTRNGLSVDLNDPTPPKYDGTHTEPNVLTAIQRVLTDTPPPGKPDLDDIRNRANGFFTYHWTHPTKREFDTPNYLEMGVTPGTALKESYIEAVDLTFPGGPRSFLVFGSGFYPEDLGSMTPKMAEDSNDGCSIATIGNTPRSALFNLFLVASVLFSVVFLRKRV